VPVALATIAWQWMFDSLYSVINWTMIALGILTRDRRRTGSAPVTGDAVR
jgi:multiple sugar transport system permease protein